MTNMSLHLESLSFIQRLFFVASPLNAVVPLEFEPRTSLCLTLIFSEFSVLYLKPSCFSLSPKTVLPSNYL